MQLACAQRKTLYQIFIDLAKAYDTLDRGRTLENLEGYGVGRRIIRHLTNLWDRQLAGSELCRSAASLVPSDDKTKVRYT
jgi:hypothetical protein